MATTRSHNNVKPLTHWVIYRGYQVRFTARREGEVRGVLTTPAGPVEFTYDPAARTIHLPDATLAINEYGWEVSRDNPGSPSLKPTEQ
ncbi:MAG: hypothetical protein DCC57_03765 [Chloroflexi bacterium]|nr:MAG: hypothetical protein DCC57_03765 [Chloroflexota bacterium]